MEFLQAVVSADVDSQLREELVLRYFQAFKTFKIV